MAIGYNSLNMKYICSPPMPGRHVARLPHGIKVKNLAYMLEM
jgi:hypothetical protein